MSGHYTIKVRAVLGADRDDAKEVRILNRYVRWNSYGERSWIEYEPDAELIAKSLKLESAKEVTTPSVKKKLEEELAISTVGRTQTRQYRAVEMRAAVFVAGQARSVVFDEGVGERHAEADGTIDD